MNMIRHKTNSTLSSFPSSPALIVCQCNKLTQQLKNAQGLAEKFSLSISLGLQLKEGVEGRELVASANPKRNADTHTYRDTCMEVP